jgi:RecA/RadA recombinase
MLTTGRSKKMKVEELKDYEGEDRVISSFEMELQQKKKTTSGMLIKTGLPSLDKAIGGGYKPGELYAISGHTKGGKTLLAQSITKNAYDQQHFACWFSYELPADQFLGCFPELPLLYMPQRLRSYNMQWITDRILESFAKFHTRIVFIDHLHFLFDMFKTKSPSLEIGTVIRRLKILAVEHGLIIFLLCHTSKSGAEIVSYQSIRDSSFVAQESDSVFMICRKKGSESEAVLRVEFHRRTGVMERIIKLVKVNGYLEELA